MRGTKKQSQFKAKQSQFGCFTAESGIRHEKRNRHFIPALDVENTRFCYPYWHFWPYFKKNLDIDVKSANRDIFKKFFLARGALGI